MNNPTAQSMELAAHAHRTIDALTARGSALYMRERDLPRLCPMMPAEAAHVTAADIVTRLKRALQRERQLGSTGHWSYDLMRHMHLAQALRAEEQALDKGMRTSGAHSA